MTFIPIELLRFRVTGLDDVRFVELCNSLLGEIAAANGIARTQLALNYHINEPDGGIDARCVESAIVVPRIIPRANTDYQFKSGQTAKSLPAIAREDIIAKPRVRESLLQGHAFVILSAWDRGDNAEIDLREALSNEGLSVDVGQVSFFGLGSLAHILEAYPSIVTRFLWIEALGAMDLRRWALSRPMANPYQKDDALNQNIDALIQRIEMPGSTVRVAGAAGDGKTRMVLEALRESMLAESVLYLPQVTDLTASLQSHLLLTRDARCTLVIDEVDDSSVERLTTVLSSRPPQIRLVMIGLDASGRPQPDTLQVEGLGEDLLARTVQAIAPGLSDEAARGIARDCERSPKLAVLLAELVRDDPSLVGSRVLAHGSVASVLDRYLKLNEDAPEWKAISTASLLMRIGWSGNAETEASALFEAVGLDVADARRAIDRLHARFGIAPIAGRYRYVSPAILADHLAAKQLGAWDSDYLKRVFGVLTPAMADSFSRRARRLSAVLPNRAQVEEVILGDQGPFRELADLDASGLAMVLHRLAAPFPWGVLRALERCVLSASVDELRNAGNSRRDCVWALEEIQWREDTFERASKLLLRFAVAENETWSNNASNVWPETFQTMLGRTAAGPQSRISVVRFAALQPEVRARLLASKAIRAAFETGSISRMGNPPSDVEGMPAREWRPATYGEWWDSLIGYLNVLEPLTTDESMDVRLEAASTLGQIVADLFHVSDRVVTKWSEIAEKLADAPLDVRSSMFRDLEWASGRWGELLAKETWPEDDPKENESDSERAERRASQRDAIRFRLDVIRTVRSRLEGQDFQSRLRATLTQRMWPTLDDSLRESRQNQFTADLLNLAREALTDPTSLDSQWDSLLANKEWARSEQWIEALGTLDKQESVVPRLRDLAQTHERARMWLSLYWLARAKAEKDDTLIDRITADLIASGDPLSAFDLTIRSACTPRRVATVIELLSKQLIPIGSLQQITYSGWLHSLETEQIRSLLEVVRKQSDDAIDAVQLLEGFLRLHPESAPELTDFSIWALGVPMQRTGRQSSFVWAQLAMRYVKHAPLELGRITLNQIGTLQTAHDGEMNQLLRASWDLSDKKEFFEQLISPLLAGRSVEAWWSRQMLGSIPLAELGVDYLISWVRSDPSNRAFALARVIGAPAGRPSDLHARLLEGFDEFGVGSAFSAEYNSGSFTGSMVDWTQAKLMAAKLWLTDERPAVQKWGRWMVANLEESLHSAAASEAEERLISQ